MRTEGKYSSSAKEPPPVFALIRRGEPTEAELAAVVAVIGARALRLRSRAVTPRPPGRRSGWVNLPEQMRKPVRVGPGGWLAATKHNY